jgi:hypothetical protein
MILDMIEHVQPLPAVRSTGQLLGPGFDVKRWLIEATGGRALARELKRRVLAHNGVLLGAYDFTEPDYRSLMLRWLQALPAHGGLLFCHPAQGSDPAADDPIAAAREREWSYLDSDAFVDDLQRADVTLGNLWPRLRSARARQS